MKKLIARILLPLLVATSSLAQSGSQKPQNEIIMSQEAARAGWGMNASTITNVIARNLGKYMEYVFDGGTWTISNHVVFTPGLSRIVIQPGTRFWLGTTNNFTMYGDDFAAPSDPIFYGPGVVTGFVNGIWGCWTNWGAFMTTPANYYLTCQGMIPTEDYWETTNMVGGDLYGSVTNLQLGTGVVTTVEILDWTIQTNDVSTNMWQFITNQAATIAAGLITTATNSLVGTNATYAFSVYMTRSAFDVPTGWTYTNVPVFEGTNYDFTGGYLQSNRFFVPVSGLWYIEGGLYDKTGNVGWDMVAGIATNHTSGIYDLIGFGQFNVTNTPSGDGASQVSRTYYLTRGTEVSLAAFNGKATPKTIQGTAPIEKPYFGGYLIAR